MNKYIPIVIVSIGLALTGCVNAGARALANADALAVRAEDAVAQNLDWRAYIRNTCEELVKEEVQELRAAGRREEARRLLYNSYTPLYSYSTYLALTSEETELPEFVTKPVLCGMQMPTTPNGVNEETGLLEE